MHLIRPVGLSLLLLPLTLAVACGDKGADTGSGGDGGAEDGGAASDGGSDGGATDHVPTWYQDVQPIVAEHCWTCHNPENSDAAFDLTDVNLVVELADWLNSKINGPDTEPPYMMPPMGLDPSPECDVGLPVRTDLRLPEEDKATFQAWIDAGTPLGDEATAAPYEIPELPTLSGDRVDETTPVSFDSHDGQTGDAYNCWSWDLGITDPEGAWVSGIQVNGDNLNILHHAVIMADFSGETAPEGGGDGKCPRPGDEVPSATMLATWVPGADPIILPEGYAFHFPAGTRLVTATHYHLTGTGQHDATTVSLSYLDKPPRYEATVLPLGAADPGETDDPAWEHNPFLIEPGDDNYVNTWRDRHTHPEDKEFRIWALFPHMHYAATAMKVTLEHPDGTSDCISEVPVFDFDFQRTYEWDAPFEDLPVLGSNDTFAIQCSYNNSESNATLRRAYEDNGITEYLPIQIGNGWLDEMCVLHAIVVQEYDGRFEREAGE